MVTLVAIWVVSVPYDLRVAMVLSGDGRGGVRPPPCERAPRGEVAAAGGAGGGRPRPSIAESLDGSEASRWGVAPLLLLLLPRLLRRRNTCWRVLMLLTFLYEECRSHNSREEVSRERDLLEDDRHLPSRDLESCAMACAPPVRIFCMSSFPRRRASLR